MKKTSKEIHNKIQSLRLKSSQAKTAYRDKIKSLTQNQTKNRKKLRKMLIIGLVILVVIIGIISFISTVIKNNEIAKERNRNYYINIDDQFTFDCNAKYDGGFSTYCEDRFISGEFSNYDTVEFSWTVSLTTEGNSFTQKLYDYVEPSYYQKEDFNIENLRDGMDKSYSFDLKNNVLNEIVASKTVEIHYNFSETDLNIINQLHDKWVKEEAERKAKAEQEAEEKAKKEAEEKAAKEEAERVEREEKAKKEAEEKAAKEEAERVEREKRSGYIGQYIKSSGSDTWTFNADGTATYTANKNIVYSLNPDKNDYHKFRASSHYMDWVLTFSEDWSTLEALNDYNGEVMNFRRL